MKRKSSCDVHIVSLAICLLLLATSVVAQPQDKSQAVASAPEANRHLSAEEIRGEGIFLQRCSLCHLPKAVKPYKQFGPILNGMFKDDADPDQMAFRRQFILMGRPDRMPGFRYTLSADELNDLIAYLKTL